MNEMHITLTSRAGCWFFTVERDGRQIAGRNHHCFPSAEKALGQALQDLNAITIKPQEEAAT